MKRPLIILLILLGVAVAANAQVAIERLGDPNEELSLDKVAELTDRLTRFKDPGARASLLLPRALWLYRMGELELAGADAFAARTYSKDHDIRRGATLLLAQIAYDRGYFSRMIWYLTDTERTGPLSDVGTGMLARALVHGGKAAAADQVFQHVLDQLPPQAPLWRDAVAAKLRLGRIDQAEQLTERYRIKAGETDGEALLLASWVKQARGDFQEALALANQAAQSSKKLSPPRKAALDAWSDLLDGLFSESQRRQGLAQARSLRSQAVRLAPMTDFAQVPAEQVVESAGAVRAEASLYGTRVSAYYLASNRSLSLAQRGPAILRLRVRLVESDPRFLEGDVGAYLSVTSGNSEYRLPVLLSPRSGWYPILEFEDAYLSASSVFFIPVPQTGEVTLAVEGLPITVEIARSEPELVWLQTGAAPLEAFDENQTDPPPYDPYRTIHAANRLLSPGPDFDPRRAMFLLERLDQARPTLLFPITAKETVQRLMTWRRMGAVTQSEGFEVGEFTGTSYPGFLRLRDAMAPARFDPGSYTLLSPDAPVRLVTQGEYDKSLSLTLFAFNPYLDRESIPAGTDAAVEVFLDNALVETIDIPMFAKTTLRLPTVPPGRHLVRVRMGRAFAGTYARVQSFDDASGQRLQPRMKSHFHVASTEQPVRIEAAGPIELRLKLRWLHFEGSAKTASAKIRVEDDLGNLLAEQVHPLPASRDRSAVFEEAERAMGGEGLFSIRIFSAKNCRITVTPAHADPELLLALSPSVFGGKGTAIRVDSNTRLTRPQTRPDPLAPPSTPQVDDPIIPWHRGGTFSFRAAFGKDDPDFSGMIDRTDCDDCGREHLDYLATHRIALSELDLHQRFSAGVRDLFGRPTVLRASERLAWRPGIQSLRVEGIARSYYQRLEGGDGSSIYLGLEAAYPYGNDLLRITPSAQLLAQQTNVTDIRDADLDQVERYVWSEYLKDHPYGPRLGFSLASRPLTGLQGRASVEATGNRDFTFGPPDKINSSIGLGSYFSSFSLSAKWAYPYYFADENRTDPYGQSEWSFGGGYGRFLPWGDRVEFFYDGNYLSNTQVWIHSLGLRFHWLRGRGMADFDRAVHPFADRIESESPQHGILVPDRK
jgi:tetratricopeptide (TPR) repeat protein